MGQSKQEYFTILEAILKMVNAGVNNELLSLVDRAIELEPEQASAHILKGGILQKADEFNLAEEAYRTALKHEPDNPQALQALGMLLVDLERYQDAFQLLLKHLSIQPQSALSLDGLLTCLSHYRVENYEKLDELFQEAWEGSHRNEIGIQYAHYLMLQKGDSQKTKNILQEICAQSPDPESLAELALAYSIDGDCEKAIKALKQAIEINPKFDRLWRGLAQCYNQIDDHASALQAAERALAIDPDHYRNLLAKAEVLANTDEADVMQEALSIIEKAKAFARLDAVGEPEARPVLRRLFMLASNLYQRLDQDEDAIRQYLEGQAVFPDFLDFYTSLFVLFMRTGKKDQAWQVLPEDVNLHTEYFDQLSGIARYFFLSNVDLALDIYQELTSKLPKPEYLMAYGYVLGTIGEYSQAIEVLERCLSQESISVETATITHANLAYLFNLTNSPSSAIETAELVFESPLKNTPAILHLPLWFSDQVFPDPVTIPGRNITPLEAAQVCYITASLMLDEVERVQPFIPVVQSWSEEQPHRYLILASIYSKQRKSVLAKECLIKALDLTEEEGVRKMIQTWLSLVKD